MNHLDHAVYSKRVRAKLDALEAKKHAAELKVREIERQIEELLASQSPIGPGAPITWIAANRERYGRVQSVRRCYQGFEYRVLITTKDGRVIGSATVREDQQPQLVVS